jgi:hypothetical protein
MAMVSKHGDQADSAEFQSKPGPVCLYLAGIFSLGMTTAMHTKNKRMSASVDNTVTGHLCGKGVRISVSFALVVKAQWLRSGYNHC